MVKIYAHEQLVEKIRHGLPVAVENIKYGLQKEKLSERQYMDLTMILNILVEEAFGAGFKGTYAVSNKKDMYGEIEEGIMPGLVARPMPFPSYLFKRGIKKNKNGERYQLAAQIGGPDYTANGSTIICLAPFFRQAGAYARMYHDLFAMQPEIQVSYFFEILDPNGPITKSVFEDVEITEKMDTTRDKDFVMKA